LAGAAWPTLELAPQIGSRSSKPASILRKAENRPPTPKNRDRRAVHFWGALQT
jgi:hypothetical protein